MSSPEFETRLASVEIRLEKVAADAAAARHLASAHERDLADLTVKVDTLRKAVNGLGVQTAERFTQVEQRLDQLERRMDGLENEVRTGFAEIRTEFAKVDAGFTEMRHRFDQTAAGMAAIVQLLTPRGD